LTTVFRRDETVDQVRVELISRLAHSGNPEHLRLVATLLEDKNWRIRAAATKALQKLGHHEWVAAQLL
jgi:HEAT repeat protein